MKKADLDRLCSGKTLRDWFDAFWGEYIGRLMIGPWYIWLYRWFVQKPLTKVAIITIAAASMFSCRANGQQLPDPSHEEFSAAVSVAVRYLEAIRRTQNQELLELEQLIINMNNFAAQSDKRLAAMETEISAIKESLKAQVKVIPQSVTVMVPAP